MPLLVIWLQSLILSTKHYDVSFVLHTVKLFWRLCLKSGGKALQVAVETEDEAKVFSYPKKQSTGPRIKEVNRVQNSKAKNQSKQQGSLTAESEEKPKTKGKCYRCGKDHMPIIWVITVLMSKVRAISAANGSLSSCLFFLGNALETREDRAANILGQQCIMQVDIRSTASFISEQLRKKRRKPTLHSISHLYISASKHKMPVIVISSFMGKAEKPKTNITA